METLSKHIINIFKRYEVKALFTIPGSLLELLGHFSKDNEIEIFTATHEEQLGYMAIGYFHASGKIPAILVTQGPGVTNLTTPICCAWRDNVPLIIITSFFSNNSFQSFQDSSGRFSSPNVSEVLKPITQHQLKFQNNTLKDSLVSLDSILSNKKISKPIFLEIENKLLNESLNFKFESSRTQKKKNWENLLINHQFDENTVFLIGYGAKQLDIDSLIGSIQSKKCKIVTTLKAIELIPSNTVGLIGNVGYLGKEVANNFLSQNCTLLISIGASLNNLTLAKWHSPFEARNGRIVNLNNNNLPKTENIYCDFSDISIIKAKYQTKHFPIINNKIFNCFQNSANKITYSIESFRKSFFDEFIIRNGDQIITTPSHAPLGCSISLAIGSAIFKNKQPHVVFCGDGGLLFSGMSILILKKYKLPIFIMVFVNNEFKTVAEAQRKKWGNSICTNLSLPDFNFTDSFFGIESTFCKTTDDICNAFETFIDKKNPFIAFLNDELI